MPRKADKAKKKAHAASTAEKQRQKATRQLLKEVGEQSIEQILADIAQQDKAATAVTISPLTAPPSPRSNCSLTPHPHRPQLILYGGEHYDGRTTTVYSDVFIFDLQHRTWKQVISPSPPPPRSAHQAVALSRGDESVLWIFGGEFQSPSASQFHHYNALYAFSLSSFLFTLSTAPHAPSARSGHRMVAYGGRYLLVFGGFHDDGRDVRFFNDLHVFDTREESWRCISREKGRAELTQRPDRWPSPRSGFALWVDEDSSAVFLYGGFAVSKDGKKGSAGLEGRQEVMSDLWKLELGSMQWQQLRKRGVFPNERSGIACAAVSVGGRRRAMLFGGVTDETRERHRADRKSGREEEKAGKREKDRKETRGRKAKAAPADQADDDDDEDDEEEDDGVSVHYNDLFLFDPQTQLFHLHQTRGSVVSASLRSIKKAPVKDKQDSKTEAAKDESKDDDAAATTDASSSSVFDFNPVIDALPAPSSSSSPSSSSASSAAAASVAAAASPCPAPRRSAAVCVKDGVLWLYGGVCESEGGREHSFADLWSLEVGKDDAWKEVEKDRDIDDWKGSDDDKDDDDDDEEVEGAEKQADEAEDDERDDEGETEAETDGQQEAEEAEDDGSGEPAVLSAETAAEFFARTRDFWLQRAQESWQEAAADGLQAAQEEEAAVTQEPERAEQEEEGDDDDMPALPPAAAVAAKQPKKAKKKMKAAGSREKELRKRAFALATTRYQHFH